MAFKRFVLFRREDQSGVSGTGIVAEGVQFSTGRCVIVWLGQYPSIGIYDSIEALEKVHGHDGSTEMRWIDE